jgi:hypothetical protein
MGDKKTSGSSFDTCFENMSFAQMKDMMAKEGVGTLCEAFMKKAMKRQKGEWSTLCHQMAERCGDGPQVGKSDKGESEESKGN